MKKQNLLITGGVIALLLAGMLVALYWSPDSTPSNAETIDTIREMMEAGDYVAARNALLRYLETRPDDAEAHFRLGLVTFNLGEFDAAREHFQLTMSLDPTRASAAHHNLGVLNYQLGDFEGAVEEFQAALAQDPDDADTHYQLGATYLVLALPATLATPDMGMLAQAEVQFQQSLTLAPGKPEALVGLGNVYLLQNEPESAIAVLEEALDINPNLREALFALGRAQIQMGDFDAARHTLQTFLDTDPPSVWAQQAEDLLRHIGP